MTSRKSTRSSGPGVSRSQRTPLARSIVRRCPAGWTTPGAGTPCPPEPQKPAPGPSGGPATRPALGAPSAPDRACPSPCAVIKTASPGSATPNRKSSDVLSSLASAYSMPTDGAEMPRSICEIRLGEQLMRRASSRADRPRFSRTRRSRGPSSTPGSNAPATSAAPMATPSLPTAPAPGRMNVDFEERVDFSRLREYRLRRAMGAMEASGLGALLVFDNNNIRYLTGVSIGEWTRDKLCRYSLYTRTGELFLWDFGSAAVHHRMYCPWLKPEHCIASYTTMRGAAPPESGLVQRAVTEIKGFLADTGVVGEPVGVDFAEIPMFFELQRQGFDVQIGRASCK